MGMSEAILPRPQGLNSRGIDVSLLLARRAIRDHILPLLREYGVLEVQRDTVRVVELKIDDWAFRHWTPFNELTAGEASSPGYRRAIERQHTRPDLPYGLDVSHGEKVLSILWADDGSIEVATFVRGAWDDEALEL
jgi:hypothetical protein